MPPRPRPGGVSVGCSRLRAPRSPAARIFRMKLSARHGGEVSRGTVPRLARAQGGPGGSAGESGVPASPPAARARGGQQEGRSGPMASLRWQGCQRTAGRAQLPRSPALPTTGKRPGAERRAVAREDGLAEEMGYFLLVSFAAFFFKREPHAPPADR